MSQENVGVVRRLFKAVEERDLAGVLAAYDPEIVIREAESLPYGGVYVGLKGAVSVYKMRSGKILESQMFHSDTSAILQFLESKK